MSLRIRCPSCKAFNTVNDDKRGRKVRCQECDERISVPEDDDAEEAMQAGRTMRAGAARPSDRDDDEGDERPRIKKREKSTGNATSIVLFLVGGGVLSLCLCCGGGSVAVMLIRNARPLPLANQDRKNRDANQNFNVVAKGKIVLNQAGTLVANDPLDPTPGLKNVHMKIHQVSMQPGKTYVITMSSVDFDAYLRVESPRGQGTR